MASSDVNAAKVAEGDKLLAEAEKCMRTTWYKWNADLDGAAHAFEKAALCYRNAKAFEKSRDVYERAADAYYKNHALFSCGKSLEQAANVCKEINRLEQSAEFLERASAAYHESGHPDTAGQVLTKAAKLVESTAPVKAAQYHLSTADLHEAEEKYRDAASSVRYGANMYARARDLDNLLGALYKLKNLYELTNQYKHLYETAALEVVVHLHRGDLIAATDTFSSASSGIHGFPLSDVAPLLDTMLQAHREGDTEAFNTACDSQVFRVMDNEMAKLVRDLKDVSGVSVIQSLGREEMVGAMALIPGPPHTGESTDELSPDMIQPTEEPSNEHQYEGIN